MMKKVWQGAWLTCNGATTNFRFPYPRQEISSSVAILYYYLSAHFGDNNMALSLLYDDHEG